MLRGIPYGVCMEGLCVSLLIYMGGGGGWGLVLVTHPLIPGEGVCEGAQGRQVSQEGWTLGRWTARRRQTQRW